MKVIKQNTIREENIKEGLKRVINLTIGELEFEGEPSNLVVQVEVLENVLKRINFVMIEDDIQIEFEEVNSTQLKNDLMDLIVQEVENW